MHQAFAPGQVQANASIPSFLGFGPSVRGSPGFKCRSCRDDSIATPFFHGAGGAGLNPGQPQLTCSPLGERHPLGNLL